MTIPIRSPDEIITTLFVPQCPVLISALEENQPRCLVEHREARSHLRSPFREGKLTILVGDCLLNHQRIEVPPMAVASGEQLPVRHDHDSLERLAGLGIHYAPADRLAPVDGWGPNARGESN